MAFAVPALPYIMGAATLYSGYEQMQASRYQAAVATANANTVRKQAQIEDLAASEDMRDRDVAARAEIAEMMSRAAASGLTATSGTMLMRQEGAYSLASRDRERLALKRDTARDNKRRQELSLRAEAKEYKRAGRSALLSSLLGVGTSYLSGATMVNDYNLGRMRLQQPSYMG